MEVRRGSDKAAHLNKEGREVVCHKGMVAGNKEAAGWKIAALHRRYRVVAVVLGKAAANRVARCKAAADNFVV